jgi:dTDP-4-dehydrorhamnose 3,5-epimerase
LKQPFSIDPFLFHPLPLDGAFLIEPIVREDNRGWFFRSYAAEAFEQAGLNTNWLQMNHSYTKVTASIRGMHYQYPPYSEVKTVRCIAGAVYDVIVDLRQDSDTFLIWYGTELSAANKKTLYIPQGFAHGFQTLTTDCELVYQHSATYQPGAEGGLRFNDEKLKIDWPHPVSVISERDAAHPLLLPDFTGIKL